MRRTIVFAGGWLAAVVASAFVGMSVIGGGASDRPLSQVDIADALSRPVTTDPPPPSSAPPASRSPSTAPTGTRGYFTNAGGTLWATCVGGVVTLSSVTPNQGYRVHDRQFGPAASARVSFRLDVDRGHAAEYELTVTCVAGKPQGQLKVD